MIGRRLSRVRHTAVTLDAERADIRRNWLTKSLRTACAIRTKGGKSESEPAAELSPVIPGPAGPGNGRVRLDPRPRFDRRHRHPSHDGTADLERLLQRGYCSRRLSR